MSTCAFAPPTNETVYRRGVPVWDSKSRDGKCLQAFVKNGLLKDMKAKDVMSKYPQFAKYKKSTFTAALATARANVNSKAVIADRSSHFRGAHGQDTRNAFKNPTVSATVMICPFVIDRWHDESGRGRISVQVHLPSGHSVRQKLTARVSVNGRVLILTLPMAPTLESASKGILSFLQMKRPETKEEPHTKKLRHHGKIQSHAAAVANMGGGLPIVYEQRIPLPRKCSHFCVTPELDEYFYGRDVVYHYLDGSTHLYVELVEAPVKRLLRL